MKEVQRELDSLIFRRHKNPTKNQNFTSIGTQTERTGRDDRSESNSSRSDRKRSSRVSPEKVKSNHDREGKTSSYDKRKSRKHESSSSSKHREVADHRSSSRKSSSKESLNGDRDAKRMDEENSRKRARSRSPTKRHSDDAKRRKGNSGKSNGRRRSKDQDDLRKVILKKRASENSKELQTDPKSFHATKKVAHSSSMEIPDIHPELVCITSSDSDEVVLVSNSVDEKQESGKVSLEHDSISQVVEEPMLVDGCSEPQQEQKSELKMLPEQSSADEVTEPSLKSSCGEVEEKLQEEKESVQSTDVDTCLDKDDDAQACIEDGKPDNVTVDPSMSEATTSGANEECETPVETFKASFVKEPSQETLSHDFQASPKESTEDLSTLSISINIPLGSIHDIVKLLEAETQSASVTDLPSKDLVKEQPVEVAADFDNVVEIAEPSELTLSCANESLDSSGSKENSFNHSRENGKQRKRKRLSYTKDVQADGETVVLTITRPARGKKKKKSKESINLHV